MDFKIENIDKTLRFQESEWKRSFSEKKINRWGSGFVPDDSSERIEEARKKIEEFLRQINKNTAIKMHYDRDIDRVIVTIVEAGTERVIRQIPPEEFVTFLKRFRQSLALIFERSV